MNLKGYQWLDDNDRVIAYYMFKRCDLVIKDKLLLEQNIDINDKVEQIVEELKSKGREVLSIRHE